MILSMTFAIWSICCPRAFKNLKIIFTKPSLKTHDFFKQSLSFNIPNNILLPIPYIPHNKLQISFLLPNQFPQIHFSHLLRFLLFHQTPHPHSIIQFLLFLILPHFLPFTPLFLPPFLKFLPIHPSLFPLHLTTPFRQIYHHFQINFLPLPIFFMTMISL